MYHAGTCRHRRCYVGLQFQCGPLKYHHNFLWTISFFCPVPPKSTKSGFFFYSDYFPPNTVERHLKAQRNWPLLALLVYFLCLVWKYSPLSLKVAEVCSILIKWISENTKHMDSWTIVLARFALKKTHTATDCCSVCHHLNLPHLQKPHFQLLSYLCRYRIKKIKQFHMPVTLTRHVSWICLCLQT